MELKKVGYCYASFNQLKIKSILKDYKNNTFLFFKVETNKGINFIVKANEKKFKLDFYDNLDFCLFYDIYGYSAGALAKFQQHTNITALSIREYNDIKGGAPYQVFIGGLNNAKKRNKKRRAYKFKLIILYEK